MISLSRPWKPITEDHFTESDCLLTEVSVMDREPLDSVVTMIGEGRGGITKLLMHPYPVRGDAEDPARRSFPLRPKKPKDIDEDVETFERRILISMHSIIDRVSELGDALLDSENTWERLDQAWSNAQEDLEPKTSEIVWQSIDLLQLVKEFDHKLRKVLRRNRELIPIDRAQEMDRASIRWLVRQPGRNMVERAGSDQRVMGITRREDFNTLENRVLHSYVVLASDVAREWLLEHRAVCHSEKYTQVRSFQKVCKHLSVVLREIEVGVSTTDVQPNYVLMQNPDYRKIYNAWRNLLLMQRALDQLWEWQAETWTDFSVLSIVLSLGNIDGASLVYQSPIVFKYDAADFGRFYAHEEVLAGYWLPQYNCLVEVIVRPKKAPLFQAKLKSPVALNIHFPNQCKKSLIIPIWALHALNDFDLTEEVLNASELLDSIAIRNEPEDVFSAIMIVPAYGNPDHEIYVDNGSRLICLSYDANGKSLKDGLSNLNQALVSIISGFSL